MFLRVKRILILSALMSLSMSTQACINANSKAKVRDDSDSPAGDSTSATASAGAVKIVHGRFLLEYVGKNNVKVPIHMGYHVLLDETQKKATFSSNFINNRELASSGDAHEVTPDKNIVLALVDEASAPNQPKSLTFSTTETAPEKSLRLTLQMSQSNAWVVTSMNYFGRDSRKSGIVLEESFVIEHWN